MIKHYGIGDSEERQKLGTESYKNSDQLFLKFGENHWLSTVRTVNPKRLNKKKTLNIRK